MDDANNKINFIISHIYTINIRSGIYNSSVSIDYFLYC